MDLPIPPSVLTDSYKAAHPFQYPDAQRMCAYGEFRRGYQKDEEDQRVVVWGVGYIVQRYLHRPWTEDDVEKAALFYSTHNAGFGSFPFPRDLFLRFVRENGGYFPVRVQALQDGSVVHARVPVYQITADAPYARLVTFLETILTHVWYPSTVATLSRRARDLIEASFERAAEGGADSPLVDSRLHDFGFRGCTCVEQATIGGMAHLLNFTGSDTMSAAYYAQFHLNGGKPVASSIPATEHSVMTAWPSEEDAIKNMIDRFGDGVFAVVMDSYDYERALTHVLPRIRPLKEAKGGYMVLRPDSGDPVEAVVMGLRGGEGAFGASVNSKGKKVLNGCGVIQGDGIDVRALQRILEAVEAEGYSPESVAFGMGSGLLHKLNRDTMSFATKLSSVTGLDGTVRDVMKLPKTDPGKVSLPGELGVARVDGEPQVFPAGSMPSGAEELLRVVYDHGPVEGAFAQSFDEMKARVKREWAGLAKRPQKGVGGRPWSQAMVDKIEQWKKSKAEQLAQGYDAPQ